MDDLYALIGAGRQLRNDYGIEPKKRLTFVIKTDDEFFRQEIASLQMFLNGDVSVDSDFTPTGVTPIRKVESAEKLVSLQKMAVM
jgi:hypothetical protein